MADNTAKAPSGNKISTKQRVLLLILCPVIVITLCSIAVVYTAHRLEPEAVGEKPDPLIGTEMPADAGTDIADFCDKILRDAASASDIKVGTDVGISLHDFGGDFSDSVYGLLNHISGQFTGAANGKYEKPSLNYGDAGASILSIPAAAAGCTEMTGEYREGEGNYVFTLTLPADSPAAASLLAEDKDVYAACMEECAPLVQVTDDRFEPDSVTAYYTYSAEKEYLVSVEFVREYKAEMNASFISDLESFGSGALAFGCRVSTKYNITNAGISIDDEMKLTKNGYQTLAVSANLADDAVDGEDFTVEFISSDESVAKVDANGMVEAVKVSETPVTVTAKLTYLGNVYEDSCTVFVTDDD